MLEETSWRPGGGAAAVASKVTLPQSQLSRDSVTAHPMSVLLSQTDGRDDLDAQAIALARAEEQLQVRAFKF